jgi:hypothetical protein
VIERGARDLITPAASQVPQHCGTAAFVGFPKK